MTDTVNVQQRLRLRILCLAELLDLAVILLDLQRHVSDLLKNRAESLSQSGRHRRRATLSETWSCGGRHTVAASLR